jgi:hypothetical protein
MNMEAPPTILVERYLMEIGKNELDSVVMAKTLPGVETDLIDVGFTDVKRGGFRGGGGGGRFTQDLTEQNQRS